MGSFSISATHNNVSNLQQKLQQLQQQKNHIEKCLRKEPPEEGTGGGGGGVMRRNGARTRAKHAVHIHRKLGNRALRCIATPFDDA